MIRGTEAILLGDLISGRVPFFVPKYQRNYAWEDEEVDDFINDLSHLHSRRLLGQPTTQKHFFGGVVSIDNFVAGTRNGRAYELVDGQQRMATFAITIFEIISSLSQVARDATTSGDFTTANSAQAEATLTNNNFLKYQEVVAGQIQYRLRITPSRGDTIFFEQLLNDQQPLVSRDSHKKLLAARDRIRDRLFMKNAAKPTDSPALRLTSLLALQASLFEDCHILHIVSDDRQEAYRLFRILNDRGRPISDGDKLRSHTLEQLEGSHLQGPAEQHWDEILDLGASDVDNFLQAYLASRTAKKPPKRELYDVFVDTLLSPNGQPQPSTYIASQVGDIRAAKARYASITEGEWPYTTSALSAWKKDRLGRLMLVLRHTICVPLLLAVSETQNEQVFWDVVSLLERFAFRYVNIVGGHHNPTNSAYLRAIQGLRASPPTFTITALHADLQGLITRYAGDNVFESNLFSKLDYNQQTQRRLIKHFLTTIEDHLSWINSGGQGAPVADETRIFDVGTNTIEHIYPQNAQPMHVDAGLEPSKHLLANLTFWGAADNQAAGNLPFISKKPSYQSSSVLMNRDLAQLPQWTVGEFATRRASLWLAAKTFYNL